MRKALVSLLFLFASSSLFSQTFSLTDTTFSIGSYYRDYRIKFYLGKNDILPDSYPLMDSIADFMKKNANLKFEIGVHTDSRGSEIANNKLSEARAKSVSFYLVGKGIDTKRLTCVGYGESKLLFPDSEVNKQITHGEIEVVHKKNRRVEFTILAI